MSQLNLLRPRPFMASHAAHALDIPETLARVGDFIPLRVKVTYPFRRPTRFKFAPKDLLNCTLVSKTFRQVLLSVLWRVFDSMYMARLVPKEIV